MSARLEGDPPAYRPPRNPRKAADTAKQMLLEDTETADPAWWVERYPLPSTVAAFAIGVALGLTPRGHKPIVNVLKWLARRQLHRWLHT